MVKRLGENAPLSPSEKRARGIDADTDAQGTLNCNRKVIVVEQSGKTRRQIRRAIPDVDAAKKTES